MKVGYPINVFRFYHVSFYCLYHYKKLTLKKKNVNFPSKTDLIFKRFVVLVAEPVLSAVAGTSQLLHEVNNCVVANTKHLHSIETCNKVM